ncbi:MAG: hypothetical protein COC01_10150 [Bacteroidetes bacterium]|nr:hypothetical protein [Bacteroidia bacterium]PCH65214.1 MAG: hypothetical protein COC01_10150 [Bacteroidota bacterium]
MKYSTFIKNQTKKAMMKRIILILTALTFVFDSTYAVTAYCVKCKKKTTVHSERIGEVTAMYDDIKTRERVYQITELDTRMVYEYRANIQAVIHANPKANLGVGSHVHFKPIKNTQVTREVQAMR